MSEYFEIALQRPSSRSCVSYFSNKSNVAKIECINNGHIVSTFVRMIESSLNVLLKDKTLCMDENFLCRFLHAKKFDCNNAMDLLLNYLNYIQTTNILKNINIFDQRIQLALSDGNPALLCQRDRRGRKVITFTAVNWNTSKYSLEDVYRALLLTLDSLLEDLQNQALGFVIIVDWTNFTFKQSTHLVPRILKSMIEGLQDCMPIKVKGIHFIAQPWYVDLVFTAVKPFLKENIRKRFYIHGSNLNSLHNLVSRDILPPELGGEAPSVNHLDWFHYLVSCSQSSEQPKTYRIIKSIVYSKPPIKSLPPFDKALY